MGVINKIEEVCDTQCAMTITNFGVFLIPFLNESRAEDSSMLELLRWGIIFQDQIFLNANKKGIWRLKKYIFNKKISWMNALKQVLPYICFAWDVDLTRRALVLISAR